MRRLVLLALLLGDAAPARELSTDVTVRLESIVAADEDVVEDGANPGRVDLGALPATADLVAYSVAPGGDLLFVLDTAVQLPGGLFVTPRDVVRYDGGATYTIELRGADRGVPVAAEIDAVGMLEGDLLLSFDVAVTLGSLAAEDEDLVRLERTQPDVWSLLFDGSAHGVPGAADLDGADVLDATGDLALSFDVSGSVGGVAFADEDVLRFAPASGVWSLLYDGSAQHAALVPADVDALFVPVPDAAPLALTSGVVLAALRRQRRSPV
jgi:hypothetical protein